MASISTKKCSLHLRGLELRINLGWRKKERGAEQAVLLDLDLCFANPLKACTTDQLADTFCYDSLVEKIRHVLAPKSFKLLEHLCHDIYHIVAMELPSTAKITVSVTKFPRIEGLQGGARFCYGDDE